MPPDSLMPGDQRVPGGFFLNRTCSIFSAQSSPHVTGDQAAMGQRCGLERLPGAHLHLALSHLPAQKGRGGQGRGKAGPGCGGGGAGTVRGGEREEKEQVFVEGDSLAC